MEKQKVKDEIAARFGKKNWLVKALPIVYCVTGVLLMTAVPVYFVHFRGGSYGGKQSVFAEKN